MNRRTSGSGGTIWYTCNTCEAGFRHFRGAIAPHCPRCHSAACVVPRYTPRVLWLILLALPVVVVVATLWLRKKPALSAAESRGAPPPPALTR